MILYDYTLIYSQNNCHRFKVNRGGIVKECYPWTRLKHIRLTRKRTARKRNRYFLKQAMHRKKNLCDRVSICLPSSIDLDAQRFELLSVIAKLHKKLKAGKRKFRIDFSNVERIIANAMLLFVAEIKNALSVYPNLQVRSLPPRSNKIAQVLQQLGLSKILGTPKVKPEDDDVIHWKHTQGNQVVGRQFETVVHGTELSKELDEKLYGGFIEAIKNSKHHAYIEGVPLTRTVSHKKTSWWMFTQEKENMFHVVICDLGHGIPCTLPLLHKEKYKAILSTLDCKPYDGYLIEQSLKLKRTRTNEGFRGNGLHRIAQIVRDTENANLTILSNRGIFHIHNGKEYVNNSKCSINGTIINWELPLPSQGDSV